MKLVILAGGLGTRFAEETAARPKPMIEIGGRPIIWHIMKIYSHYGVNDFIVCLGYRGFMIKEYFSNYALHMSDVTIDTSGNGLTVHRSEAEDWRISLIDTGEATQTGGRLKRVLPYLKDEGNFCLTYGDGVSNVDIGALVNFHVRHGRRATVTAVHPPSRFGQLGLQGDEVSAFMEKPPGEGGWINGGFFVLSNSVSRYIVGDETIWEREPLERLAQDRELMAYRHDGFWQPMDTLRDRQDLEALWQKGRAPWKVWR